MKQKLLITGSNGFIASHILNNIKNDYDIITVTKDMSCTFVMNKYRPNVILNLGAEIKNDDDMFKSNIVMTEEILKYARHNLDTVEKIIHVGSSTEYGRKHHPTTERDLLEPRTLYEATKAAATMLCRGYAVSYNVPVAIIRPYTVYGLGEKKGRFIPKIIETFKTNGTMDVYDGYHDFTYIDDFVRGFLRVLSSDKDYILGDIINFGHGVQRQNFEVLDIIARYFPNSTATFNRLNTFMYSYDSRNWQADNSLAKIRYNIHFPTTLEMGIDKMMKGI